MATRRPKTPEEKAAQYLRLKDRLHAVDYVRDTGYDAFIGENSTKNMYSRRYSRSKYKRRTEASDRKAQKRIDALDKRLDKAAKRMGISTKVKEVSNGPGSGLGYMTTTHFEHEGSPFTKALKQQRSSAKPSAKTTAPEQKGPRRRMKTLAQAEEQYNRIMRENELNTPRRFDPSKTPRGKRIIQAFHNVQDNIMTNLGKVHGGRAKQYIPEYTDGEPGVSPWFLQYNYDKPVPSNMVLDKPDLKIRKDHTGNFNEPALRSSSLANVNG